MDFSNTRNNLSTISNQTKHHMFESHIEHVDHNKHILEFDRKWNDHHHNSM